MNPIYSISSLFAARCDSPGKFLVALSVAVLAVFYTLIHVYVGIYGAPDSQLMNSLHVTIALVLVFILNPLLPAAHPRFRIGLIFDLLCIAGSIACMAYFLVELKSWTLRTVIFRPIDMWIGLTFCFLIFEATRRTVGMTLVVICLVFVVYALYANYAPGMFYGAPVKPMRLLQTIMLGDAGIFGVAVAVMAQYVVIFILFGAVLNRIGGGHFFTRLAFSMFGHRQGGPAKAAVVSSGLLGTLSGSAIGNVVSTGVFTIPLMKRMGYKAAFAGGVEAAASNGGMIMPPVMGAVAFIMADMMGVAYSEIVAAALIPALLYYLTMFVQVDLEARKLGLKPIEKALLPRAWGLLKSQGYYLLPLVVVTVAMLLNYSIVMVGVISIGATIALGVMQRKDRLHPLAIAETIEDAARATVSLSVTAAAAGIMLGAIFATGLSYQISQAAVTMTDGNVWALILLCGVLAIFMGMGMSAAAVYITLAATVVPVLKLAGVPEMAAHFYAFYFGIASNITPPIALTAYAAAPIAQSKPFATSVVSARLGISCLLLPVLFIYHPAILMIGSWTDIIIGSLTAAAALIGLAAAMTGYAFRAMSMGQRLVLGVAALLLFAPEFYSGAIGVVIGGLILWNNYSGPEQLHADIARAQVKAETDSDEAPATESWFDRLMSRRMTRELAGDGVVSGPADVVPQVDQSALLHTLTSEAEPPARVFNGWSLGFAWGVALVIAGAFQFAGDRFMQASAPLTWVALMFAASVVLVLGMMLAGKLARRSPELRPAHAA